MNRHFCIGIVLVLIFVSVLCSHASAVKEEQPSIAINAIDLQAQQAEVAITFAAPSAIPENQISKQLKIFVDGQPAPETQINPSPSPTPPNTPHFLIIWDHSKSISPDRWQVGKQIYTQILKRLPAESRVALIAAGDKAEDLTSFTEDRLVLQEALEKLQPVGKRTLLNEAIYAAVEKIPNLNANSKGIILFTDGLDDGSYLKDNDCVQLLMEAKIPLVTVDLGSKASRGADYLKRLARVSQGYYYERSNAVESEIAKIMGVLSQPFPNTFSIRLHYPSPLQAGPHELTTVLLDQDHKQELAKATRQFFVPAPATPIPGRETPWPIINLLNLLLLFILLILGIIAFVRYSPKKESVSILLDQENLPEELGKLRQLAKRLQEEAQTMEQSLLRYGDVREGKISSWKGTSINLAKRAVSVLKTCWLERDEDLGQNIYDELLNGLKSIGVEEIKPQIGEVIDDNDERYLIKEKKGSPPYKVSEIVYPGYFFRPRLGKYKESGDERLLEPAHVKLEGSGAS